MKRAHALTRDESAAINSILDDEESRFSGGSQLRPRLSELDEQCRQIWPNWEPMMSTRSSRPETPEMRPARRAPVADATPKPLATPLSSDRRTPQIRPTPRAGPSPARAADEIDSVKSEVNLLMARIRAHGSPPVGQGSSPPALPEEIDIPSIPDHARKIFSQPEPPPPRQGRWFEAGEPRTFEAPRLRQFEQPDPLVDLPTRTSPAGDPGTSGMPDFLKLQQENVRLKAELLKTRKRLQAAEEEIKKLQMAIEKSEALRKRAKQQLAAAGQTG